jgi:hypothetical protein
MRGWAAWNSIAAPAVMAGSLVLLILWALTLAPQSADANPVYAFRTGQGCTTCHAFPPPALNDAGKRFKANGYKM